jgi:hypothetical protein
VTVNPAPAAVVAVPAGVVTDTGPEVAPSGTVTVSDVPLLLAMGAETALKVTAVASPRLVPAIVTLVPKAPLEGVSEVSVGAPGAGPPPLLE